MQTGDAMDNWDELRTAWQVARLGTVSGAAEVLGVHHATVIRHIDALEKRLGARLFQRHAKGYTPTEAGQDLLKVASQAHENFAQLASRIRGQGELVSGELVVTAVSGLSDLLVPVLARFRARFPEVTIRFLTDLRVFRLEQGEAHVAIRAGQRPQEPDYVVQPFCRLPTALYAARGYVEAHGLPSGPESFAAHRFIGVEGPLARAPFHRWLDTHAPASAFALRVTDVASALAAVRAGMGIGFVAPQDAAMIADLVEVMAPIPEWDSPLWIVTHVDLHRTLKVQSFLAELKTASAGWVTA
jgi:DNA-binding transcriptional LysR family regulator